MAYGFLVAPAIGLLMMPLLTFIATGHSPSWPRVVDILFSGITFWAYATVLVFGLPTYMVFHRLRLFRFWHSAVAGVVLGSLAFAAWNKLALGSSPHMSDIVYFGVLGMATTSAFWLIAMKSEGERKPTQQN